MARPILNKEKKETLNVTIAKDLKDLLRKEVSNISKWIEEKITQDFKAPSPKRRKSFLKDLADFIDGELKKP